MSYWNHSMIFSTQCGHVPRNVLVTVVRGVIWIVHQRFLHALVVLLLPIIQRNFHIIPERFYIIYTLKVFNFIYRIVSDQRPIHNVEQGQLIR